MEYFTRLYRALNLPANTHILLTRDDGVILATHPFDPARLGSIFVPQEGEADDLVATSRVADLPLTVALVEPRETALSHWHSLAVVLSPGALLAVAGLGLLTAGLVRRVQRDRDQERLQRQQLEEAVRERTEDLRDLLAFNRTMIDASPIGIAAYTRDGQCLTANGVFQRILGMSQDTLLAKRFEELPLMTNDTLDSLRIGDEAKGGPGPLRRRRRKWPWVLAGLLLLGVGYRLLRPRSFAVQTAPVALVSPSRAITTLSASGYVVAQRKAALATKVTSQLAWLGVEEGSRVQKGQILARLEHADLDAARKQAAHVHPVPGDHRPRSGLRRAGRRARRRRTGLAGARPGHCRGLSEDRLMAVPLSYSWRNLAARRLTTALTAGGMALVVFVFTATLMPMPRPSPSPPTTKTSTATSPRPTTSCGSRG